MGISWIGAVIGLLIAIILILKKMPVFFGMMIGALAGGIIGFIIWKSMNAGSSVGWNEIVSVPVTAMFNGGKGIMPVILRVLASGVLAGALIHTGATKSIARKFIKIAGVRYVLLAIVLTALVLTASGVFVDITVITLAPIALSVAKEAKLSRAAILIAMIGGGKAGNLMSPNPNTISAASSFHVSLVTVMAAGAMVAIVGVIVTFAISYFKNKSDAKNDLDMITEIGSDDKEDENLPPFFLSILGPIVAILILTIRPVTNSFGVPFVVDPLIALPLGGLVTIFVLGYQKETISIITKGLARMVPVGIMLAGTGMISGVISGSDIAVTLTDAFKYMGLPTWLLAPTSGILFGFATGSTTAGTTVASGAFATTVGYGVGGAAMTHAGATVLDSVPHGSFFHSTAGAVNMKVKDRLKLIGWEAAIGASLVLASTAIFGIIGVSF